MLILNGHGVSNIKGEYNGFFNIELIDKKYDYNYAWESTSMIAIFISRIIE